MGRISREKFKVYEGVFDESTLNVLESLKRKKYFDELGKPIKTGKEGDVYFAYKNDEPRALKMYRITSASFRKLAIYIQRDFRFKSIRGNLRKVMLAWSQKEFRNLLVCHKANMNVPFAYKQVQNVIVMEYINGGMLKDSPLEDPRGFFDQLLEQMYLMKNVAFLVHGDLSEFNILVRDNAPVIIDLGQAMNIKNDEDFKNVYDLYERDIRNVVNYFNKKYNLGISELEVFEFLDNKKN